jgi:CelD/BcsL family acetyltransferase involved in cellulose biosynthesis
MYDFCAVPLTATHLHSLHVEMSALHSELGTVSVSHIGKIRPAVRVCRTWAELEKFLPAWNHLLQTCSHPSIFVTPEWLAAWWQAFGADKELLALVFHDAEENIIGLAPMYAEQRRFCGMRLKLLRLVGAGSGDSDALDFIIAPGYEQACAEVFLNWLADANRFDICALETLPQNSAIARHLSSLARQSRLKLYPETAPHLFIDLPATWPEYLEALVPAFRPLLTRYPRRLQSRFNVSIARCEHEADLASSLDALFTLHQMRWSGRGEPGAFSNPERRDFYLRMAHAFQARGWLEFWLLRLDSEIVAAQFCFRYRDTVSLLQEGFHPKYAAEKVGYALRAHVLQEMIKTGARRYDFLGGADTYKAKFSARLGSYINLRLAATLRGRICLAARHRKDQLKQWLKRRLPAAILSALGREKAKLQNKQINNRTE